ncbi:hypothetical protein B0H13DRAFT_648105 [Mycena leptocephala]|nr:hypothetical protein B0H13DRAFT_648105 [Mycena leptocephala]
MRAAREYQSLVMGRSVIIQIIHVIGSVARAAERADISREIHSSIHPSPRPPHRTSRATLWWARIDGRPTAPIRVATRRSPLCIKYMRREICADGEGGVSLAVEKEGERQVGDVGGRARIDSSSFILPICFHSQLLARPRRLVADPSIHPSIHRPFPNIQTVPSTLQPLRSARRGYACGRCAGAHSEGDNMREVCGKVEGGSDCLRARRRA